MVIAGCAASAILGFLLILPAAAQTATMGGGSLVKPHAMADPSLVSDPVPSFGVPAEDRSAAPGGPVDINAASAAELGKIRFIGRKRAAAIISGRPWRSPDELVSKKVVPTKYFDQIKDRLVAR